MTKWKQAKLINTIQIKSLTSRLIKKMLLKLSRGEKRMFWAVQDFFFGSFTNIWIRNLNVFFWETKQKLPKLFKSKVCNTIYFRKWFWSYFKLKNKCSDRLKPRIFVFCKSFSDVNRIVWKSKSKSSKLFESTVCYGGDFWKWLRSAL